MRKRRQPDAEPGKIVVTPPDRLFIAWGLYRVPASELADAQAYGYPICPWVAHAHYGLAITAARSGFHLLNTYWGTDEESCEQAIKLVLGQAEINPETVAVFAMGFPQERLVRLGHEDGKHLAIAEVPIEGKPAVPRDALETLPKAGW